MRELKEMVSGHKLREKEPIEKSDLKVSSFKNESSDDSEEEQTQFEVNEKKANHIDQDLTSGEFLLQSIGKLKD